MNVERLKSAWLGMVVGMLLFGASAANARECTISIPKWCKPISASYYPGAGSLDAEHVSILCRENGTDWTVLVAERQAKARALLYPSELRIVQRKKADKSRNATLECE